MANSITTVKAREKFAKAHHAGASVPKIAQIGFGNGGHNASTGQPVGPNGAATQVPGEFYKKNIDSIAISGTTVTIVGSLQLTESNGNIVSSAGLYDTAGDLVAIKNFSPKTKDDETVIEIEWKEEF